MTSIKNKTIAILISLCVITTFMPVTAQNIYAAQKLGKAKITSIKANGNKVTIRWKKAKAAKKYQVYVAASKHWEYVKKIKKSQKAKYSNTKKYKLKKSGSKYKLYKKAWNFKKVKTTGATTYTYCGKYTKTYVFKVRGVNGGKKGKFSPAKKKKTGKKTVSTQPTNPEEDDDEDDNTDDGSTSHAPVVSGKPPKVTSLKATYKWVETSKQYKITLTWNGSGNYDTVDEYVVRYSKDNGAKWSEDGIIAELGSSTKKQYVSSQTSSNTKYTFKVTSVYDDIESDPVKVTVTTPSSSSSGSGDSGDQPSSPATPEQVNIRYENTTSPNAKYICTTDKLQYSATVTPSNASQNVTWSITGNGGHITSNGLCTFDNAGTFLVKAKASNGVYKEESIDVVQLNEYGEMPIIRVDAKSYEFGTRPSAADIASPKNSDNYKNFQNTDYYDRKYILIKAHGVQKAINYSVSTRDSARPVKWEISENTIGAKTETIGNDILICIDPITKDNYEKTVTVKASLDDKSEEITIKGADIPVVKWGYEDILRNDQDPKVLRSFLWPDEGNASMKRTVDELVKNCTTDEQKIEKLIIWFSENIEYEEAQGFLGNGMSYCWSKKKGRCGHQANMLAQMLRYAGIPAGFYEINPEYFSHAVTVFFMNGEWYAIDATGFCIYDGDVQSATNVEQYYGPARLERWSVHCSSLKGGTFTSGIY